MNPHYTYFLILACSVAGPLALSFDKKVAFYKKWKYLFPAMIIPAALYIIWDFYFTSKAVWSFNPNYITGIKVYNLPIEEVLFFIIIPYCCIFIYECVKVYCPKLKNTISADVSLKILAALLLITGVFFYNRYYTSWTFIFTAAFIFIIYLAKDFFISFNALLFVASYAVMLVPFLIVNGLLTSIPIVLYSNAENLGIRIYTIPFEDVFYGMLLILMSVTLYEKQQAMSY